MKIMLLGANGQVGGELRRSLSPAHELVLCGRAEADLSNLDQLRSVVGKTKADVIVNAAAYTAVDKAQSEPDVAERINHEAVALLASLAKQTNTLLIHYSTDYVFDGTKPMSYVETDTTNPLSVYGATKLRGEEAIRVSACHHIIFRTSWVYATRGHNFVKTMLRLATEREQLSVVSDQIGAPTSAGLIADITAQAIARPVLSGTYHLTAAGETSWHGFATLILDEAQKQGLALKADLANIKAIPTSAYPTPATRPGNSRLNTDKLRTGLGIALPAWETQARRVVAAIVAEHKK